MVKLSRATSQLAEYLGLELLGEDVLVSGVSISAGEVEPGDIFVAIQGSRHHGLEFLDQAIKNGAVAVLSDRPSSLPTIISSDPKAKLGELCNLVLGEPKLQLFGVTGTNGKTSTVSYLHQLLTAMGEPSGLSGSTGFQSQQRSESSLLTTPELPTLRKFLSRLELEGARSAVLEVSAQALIRHRVSGLRFAVSGFTNLSRDHLDDFGSMEQYFKAKAQLFDPSRSAKAVVFVSDPWAKRLAEELAIPRLLIGPGQEVEYRFESGRLELSGRLNLSVEFRFGELMARNLSVALGMLFVAGYSSERLESAAGNLSQVPGRLERVSDHTPHVYVDYAHTPDGIASAVTELMSRYPGVTLVFGASGNRDQGKRAEMGVAASGATLVVLTDQHPRDEDPAAIRAQIRLGLDSSGKQFEELADPEAAIRHAISITPREHAVLWCGPGHLEYREIAGSKVPFDAREIAKTAVEKS